MASGAAKPSMKAASSASLAGPTLAGSCSQNGVTRRPSGCSRRWNACAASSAAGKFSAWLISLGNLAQKRKSSGIWLAQRWTLSSDGQAYSVVLPSTVLNTAQYSARNADGRVPGA